ncbi:hypothetical protein [Flagellimonas pacifica]|uniref:Glycine zipper domain-containing protein n=1 Tax=Flagellimonas pacifica TaxID=1247520 RepID=A0A285MVS2_9FLAO|nr:hypothetical protein [Allomuricauda parva]SNZ01284.1 hypothetical protein SAMN06265377_3121 [Allomuricauda parva]
MRKIKTGLHLILALLIVSCSTESENLTNENQQIDYNTLISGLGENLTSFEKMLEYDESLTELINELIENDGDLTYLKKSSKSEPTLDEEVIYKKEDLSDTYSESQKEFLVNFYNELANNEAGYILDVVMKYKVLLNNQNFSSVESNQIYSILMTSEQSILIFDKINEVGSDEDKLIKSSFSSKGSGCGFWCCMRKNAGKAIGRGIAGGAITGAISGGYYGATGGTVILPGIGTATGAVGGAVFGAAAGAVVGGVTSAVWTTVDCGGASALKEWTTVAMKVTHDGEPIEDEE